jgi:phage tail sheath gpL-like
MPIIAYDDTTSVKISAKTKGELGNDLKIKLFGIEQGIVFTVPIILKFASDLRQTSFHHQ